MSEPVDTDPGATAAELLRQCGKDYAAAEEQRQAQDHRDDAGLYGGAAESAEA